METMNFKNTDRLAFLAAVLILAANLILTTILILTAVLISGSLVGIVHAEESTAAQNENHTDFERLISGKGLPIALVTSFLLGLGVSFTPCVWPMYPITVGVVLGERRAERSALSGLFPALVYVLGISITYAAIGLLSGLLGAQVQVILRSPVALIGVALIFVALALSMFGLYDIRMPTILSRGAGAPRRGTLGLLAMGFLSGLVISPCVAAPLAGVLLFIATTGKAWQGFWLLFTFAWGMGIILLIIATSTKAASSLPKAGPWMVWVKRILGVVLLLLAVYTAWPAIPSIAGTGPIGDEGSAVEAETALASPGKSGKAGSGVAREKVSARTAAPRTRPKSIQWIHDEQMGLARAAELKRPAMIDFFAEWCAYCKRLDREVFTDPSVIAESERFVPIKVDATENSPEVRKILSRYKIVGFPTVLFIDSGGRHIPVVGYRDARTFLGIMKNIR
jgi:thiol:disulfide interchange protein DsbD